jgi:hypothetical protein
VEEAICILSVLRKKNNSLVLRRSSSSYQWRHASQYDSRRHSNMAQTRPKFFHIDSLTPFCYYECEKSRFGSPLSRYDNFTVRC